MSLVCVVKLMEHYGDGDMVVMVEMEIIQIILRQHQLKFMEVVLHGIKPSGVH